MTNTLKKQPISKRPYALLAAEPSGDIQAAALAKEILKLDPKATFIGIGGQALKAAGADLIVDTSAWATIGPFEVFIKLPKIILSYWRLKSALASRNPIITVMIDSPALFMRLAKWTLKRGLKTVYYFPPSAWTDSSRRARSIATRVNGVVCAFERQYRTYRRAEIPAQFFGHPLVDVVQRRDRLQALQSLGLPPGRYLAMMPGSRLQEVRLMTPIYLEAAKLLKTRFPELTFLLPAASQPAYCRLQQLLEGSDIMLFNGQAQQILSVSEAAIVTSGSATLEAAYLGCPFILAYRFNPFDAKLARILMRLGLMKVPRFGLPNLILNEDIIPELLQEEVTPSRLYAEIVELLEGGKKRQKLLKDLGRVREKLGTPPVVPKVAEYVLEVARS